MSTKKEIEKPLSERLLEGFAVKARANGTVINVKNGDGATVAEICVGTKKTRLNIKAKLGAGAPAAAKELGGKSTTWKGGGFVVTEKNLVGARALLKFICKTKSSKTEPTAAQAAADLQETQKAAKAAASRVKETSSTTVTATA